MKGFLTDGMPSLAIAFISPGLITSLGLLLMINLLHTHRRVGHTNRHALNAWRGRENQPWDMDGWMDVPTGCRGVRARMRIP